MVNEIDAKPSDPTLLVEHHALLQRLNDAGYKVLEVRHTERGMVWTLEPLHSRVEFELVGKDELLRFLEHH
ncbi:hypothetical protein [Hydrogenophaga sp.]|uniref:hypothetical protein n=1 Tax=Hydrogenophaga sp. TaxID=1904254 RepID=UPI00263047DE|nr:hypothetical protein [Hydrogenophaga sp.]